MKKHKQPATPVDSTGSVQPETVSGEAVDASEMTDTVETPEIEAVEIADGAVVHAVGVDEFHCIPVEGGFQCAPTTFGGQEFFVRSLDDINGRESFEQGVSGLNG